LLGGEDLALLHCSVAFSLGAQQSGAEEGPVGVTYRETGNGPGLLVKFFYLLFVVLIFSYKGKN
jgi:hypothetical protein